MSSIVIRIFTRGMFNTTNNFANFEITCTFCLVYKYLEIGLVGKKSVRTFLLVDILWGRSEVRSRPWYYRRRSFPSNQATGKVFSAVKVFFYRKFKIYLELVPVVKL